jgi:hypothetical protein
LKRDAGQKKGGSTLLMTFFFFFLVSGELGNLSFLFCFTSTSLVFLSNTSQTPVSGRVISDLVFPSVNVLILTPLFRHLPCMCHFQVFAVSILREPVVLSTSFPSSLVFFVSQLMLDADASLQLQAVLATLNWIVALAAGRTEKRT